VYFSAVFILFLPNYGRKSQKNKPRNRGNTFKTRRNPLGTFKGLSKFKELKEGSSRFKNEKLGISGEERSYSGFLGCKNR